MHAANPAEVGAFLLGAAGSDDPYPGYAALRDAAAVHRLPIGGMRFVGRYADTAAAVRDHRRFSSDVMAGANPDGTRMIISTDPPDHTTLRRLVTKPFRPTAIAALEGRIRSIAEGLVDDLLAADRRGEADLIDHLGAPLPVTVIAEMLGIPVERRDEFRRWSNDAISGMGGRPRGAAAGGSAGGTAGGSGGDDPGAWPMGTFFRSVIAERRRQPGTDLISALLAGDEPLSEVELVLFCITLLIAGNETTTNLVGNAFSALFAHPEQAERLWADPALVPAAIEEALRYDPPAQMVVRRTTEAVEVGGTDLAAGTVVLLGLASANRDPRRYAQPDAFDIGRGADDHLAFGNGVHLCLGAPLARLEAKVVLEVLIERTRGLARRGPGRRKANPLLRGFDSLPVAVLT